MLLFTQKSQSFQSQFCRDARTAWPVVSMCGGQPCWQPVAVSVQIVDRTRLREELGPKYLVGEKDPHKTFFPCVPRRHTCWAPAGPFPLPSDPGLSWEEGQLQPMETICAFINFRFTAKPEWQPGICLVKPTCP